MTSLLILSGFFSFSQYMFADSPLTSTDFWKAYQNEKIVITAAGTKGILTTDLMDWLDSEENPIAIKMAIINRLGWEVEGRNNSSMFFDYLKEKRGYKNNFKFFEKGEGYELLCMAYLKAMENYFEVDDAIAFAEKAKLKKPGSYTFNIICALIKAQKALNYDWCEVYNITDRVRKDKSLVTDINYEACRIIFEYMDLYRESCGKKSI